VSVDRQKRERLRQFEARQQINQRKKALLRKDQWVWTLAAVVAVTISSLGLFAYHEVGPGAPPRAPNPALSENREWTGSLEMGSVDLSITLDGQNAPQATANFISLAEDDFYIATTCHRLTTDEIFVLQCGDPTGSGLGGPGYAFGPIENAPEGDLYPAGTLAMARAPNNAASMGSQFFIVYEDSVISSDIAGGYTVLGQITTGLEDLVRQFVEPGTADGSTDGQPAAIAPISRITIR
jgi:peptidyl-prolyl cis-trans isomerase B (cyclophilin B)